MIPPSMMYSAPVMLVSAATKATSRATGLPQRPASPTRASVVDRDDPERDRCEEDAGWGLFAGTGVSGVVRGHDLVRQSASCSDR